MGTLHYDLFRDGWLGVVVPGPSAALVSEALDVAEWAFLYGVIASRRRQVVPHCIGMVYYIRPGVRPVHIGYPPVIIIPGNIHYGVGELVLSDPLPPPPCTRGMPTPVKLVAVSGWGNIGLVV